MTIHQDHPVTGPILEGGARNQVQTMKYDKNGKPELYNLIVKAGYEGSPSRCGKNNCKEHPHYFVADLWVGIPRFLCQTHARRWVQKRRELLEKDKGFIYVFVVMPDTRGNIDVYLQVIETDILLRGLPFDNNYIKKKGKDVFAIPQNLPPLLPPPPSAIIPAGPTGCTS
jgi:hypothetical protein